MKSKKIISLFLFLVLSVQVLPLRQIAAWLSANPFSEEAAGEIGTVQGKATFSEIDSDFQNFHSIELNTNPELVQFNHQQEESLVIRHPDDVITPPPNYLPFPS
jgi:hypothetical protein